MDRKQEERVGAESGDSRAMEFLEPLREALLEAAEPERYRLLASLLSELADSSRSDSNGRKQASGEQLESMAKRIQSLDQQRATLDDAVRTTQSDLERVRSQLEAEKAHAGTLQGTLTDKQARFEEMEKKYAELEAEVVAKNSELHKRDVQIDELTLTVQRAEVASEDDSRSEAREQKNRDLVKRYEALAEDREQLRQDKDAEIQKLREQLLETQKSSSADGDTLLRDMWERLGNADPSLAELPAEPNRQAADRLVDGFVVLAKFVNDFDKSTQVFLKRWTQHENSVRVPWAAYARGDDLVAVARRTVAPQGGRPAAVMRMRLRLVQKWIEAGMVASDAVVARCGSELEAYLRGEHGMGSNPNTTIREFIRADGSAQFGQQMQKLHSKLLADAFGRGG